MFFNEQGNPSESSIDRFKYPIHVVTLFLLLCTPLLLISCSDNPASTDNNDDNKVNREVAWEQTLESNANNWLTDEVSGPTGWCGDIVHHTSNNGPYEASNGSGYAIAEHGACNDYWQENGFPSSGPYAFYGKRFDQWPSGGFAQSLDIFLNPAWAAGPEGSVFTFSNAFRLLDGEYPNNLRYVYIPVTKKNGKMRVAGNEISGRGWYNFHVDFTDNEGNLQVQFTLRRDGNQLFTEELTETAISEEKTSSFEANNIGNGYAWFVAINPNLRIPFDEQERLE